MKSLSVTTQLIAIEQYFPVVLFIILYACTEMILTFRAMSFCRYVTSVNQAGFTRLYCTKN